jgi:transcriptional regulator with XRE-family HTH domain
MSQEQKIKTACAYAGFSQARVARAIDMTPSNFSQKLKRSTFTDEELAQIAKAIGADFTPFTFVFSDGMKV